MLRHLILGTLLATAAVAPTAAVAHEPAGHAWGHRRYEVLVRHRHHWHVHGTYRDLCDAERAAHGLRHQGYDVRIERA